MNRLSAPRYDLFKTIVAVVLAIILILMLLRGCAVNPASPAPLPSKAIIPPAATETLVPSPASTETAPAAEATQTVTSSPTPTEVQPTTAAPTLTPTAATTEAATVTPESATATPQAQGTSCNTSMPSRLSVGQTARVLQRLNMRRDASITAPILLTSPIDTQVQIIGGPVCTPVGDHAYLWWQIRQGSGAEGWSAEMPLNEATYFLEPVQ
jgi:hypothetical protein